jgi:LysR family transcriptional regulator, low CO2-responsive transcriptional regulator
MKNLTLRSLRIFEATAACASFSRAAELLELTQPAVSMQIRQLESEVGMALFDKRARPLALTDAGRELLVHARAILSQVRIAEDALGSLQGALRGQLHLGVVATANYFAPLLMQAFRQLHPEIRLKLSLDKRDPLLASLAEHRLDIVIAGFPPALADVEAEPFARHPHCIVAHPGHRLAGQRDIPWAALRDEPFLFREPGSATRQFLDHLLLSNSLRVNRATELHGTETIKQAVMVGMGISFLSAHAFQVEAEAGRMIVLDVVDMPKMLDWCVLHRRDSSLTGVNEAFRAFVLERGAALVACRHGGSEVHA